MKFCTNCGAKMEDRDQFCRNCGAKTGAGSGNAGSYQGSQPSYSNPYQESQSSYSNPYQDSQSPYSESIDFGGQDDYNPDWLEGDNDYGENSGGKRARGGKGFGGRKGSGSGSKMIFILAAAAAVIILGAVAVFALPGTRNLLKKTFSSPDEYYQYVEEQTIKELSSQAASTYENLLHSNLNVDDRGIDYNVGVSVSDESKDFLSNTLSSLGLGGLDLEWLGGVSMDGRIDSKDGRSSVTANVDLNGKKILSGNIIADLVGNAVYGQIAELSSDYIAGDLSARAGNAVSASLLGALRQLSDACPDEKTAEDLMERYLTVIVENLTDVERSTSTLSASGVSANYTALDVSITAKTIANALYAVADTMDQDTELRGIFENALTLDFITFNSTLSYNYLVSQIRTIAQSVANTAGTEAIKMTVWVDGSGVIRGRSIGFNDTEYFHYYMPKDGRDFGLDAALSYEGTSIGVTGDGTISGSKMSGEFRLNSLSSGLSLNGELLKVTLDDLHLKEAKEGYLVGKISLSPGRGMLSLLSRQGVSSVFTALLSGASLDLDLTNAKNSSSAVIGISLAGTPLASLTFNTKTGRAKSFKMIDTAKTPERYVQDLDFSNVQGVIENLENAGVPSFYTETLEQYAESYVE